MTTEKKPHKHAAIIKAWADGAEIEFYSHSWLPCPTPSWSPYVPYRVKPIPHKHQSFIDAYKAGKKIQFLALNGEWADILYHTPLWCLDIKYRIKPEVVEMFYEVDICTAPLVRR